MVGDPYVTLWDFFKSQIIFIIAAISAAVAFVKYITKKHDEHYDTEVKRIDTRIDNLKELLLEKITNLKDRLGWAREPKSHDE